MSTSLSDLTFKLYAICAVILSLEMLFLGAYTAATRAKHKSFVNPEDARVSPGGSQAVAGGVEHPDVARILRAHRNLIESLPIFFALGLIYVLAGAPALGAKIGFPVFTAARVIHAVVYIKELQPWRTIAFAIGTLTLLTLMGLILYTVLA